MTRASLAAGFSLVELMIVVAIIGILAAIAVPNYISMQLKAKRAEIPVSVDGIRTCEQAYNTSFDAYLEAPVNPRPDSDLNKTQFDWTTTAEWSSLLYFPTGAVRGNYRVQAGETDFTVIGRSDVDNDDTLSLYTATNNMEGELAGPNVY